MHFLLKRNKINRKFIGSVMHVLNVINALKKERKKETERERERVKEREKERDRDPKCGFNVL